MSFILMTATYNLGHIFYLWFLLCTSGLFIIYYHLSTSSEPNGDIVLAYSSTHILIFIMANLNIYSAFYITMKLFCGERPTNWVRRNI